MSFTPLTQSDFQSQNSSGFTPLTAADVINAQNQPAAPTPQPSSPDLGQLDAQNVQGGVDKIKSSISDAAQGYQEGVTEGGFSGILKSTKSLLQGGLGTAAGFAQTLFAPITAVAQKSGIPDAFVQGNKPLFDYINSWATKHPNAAKNLQDAITVITAGLGDDIAGDAKVPTVSDVAGDAKNAISDAKTAVTKPIKAVKEAISPTLTPEEQTGNIIQGKTTDIPAAQRTFDALPQDSKAIAKMSPSDLSNSIQDNIIQKNLDSVGEKFSGDTNTHTLDYFDQTIGSGKSAVTTNYVQQAIDQLKEFYAKTNDAQGLSDTKALEEKANTEGLTSGDLNQLAKEHGSTIKAFNANGEAASGLSKQAAENTRTGVKTTARNVLSETNPEGATDVTNLDRQTSEAIKTKDLLDKQVEKEAQTVQKNGKQGIIKKVVKTVKKNPIISTAAAIGADKVIKNATGIGF